jgi:hypothetical protein
VVVQHNDVGSHLPGGIDRWCAVGSAVDGDDQPGAARDEFAHRFRIGTVTLENPVWNIDFGFDAVVREKPLQKRRGRRSVDIVVAEDRHLLATANRVGDAGCRRFHVGQRGRIGQQLPDRRIEEGRNLVDPDASPRKHPGDDIRHAMSLRHGERRHLLAFVQAVFPGESGHRPPDAQKAALLDDHAPIRKVIHGRRVSYPPRKCSSAARTRIC